MSDQRIGTSAQLLATLYTDIHPPLFVLFMHYWNSLFGDGEVAMRIPAMISGLLCIPLTYWVGSRLTSKTAAMIAAALLAISPVHVWYCAEARLYAPMVTTTLIAFGCIDRLTDPLSPHRRGLLWLCALNMAVMLSLHFYLAVIVATLAAVAPILAGGITPTVRKVLWSHGAGLVLLAAFVFAKMQIGEFETSQDYLRAFSAGELFSFLFDWSWSGSTLPSSEHALVRGLGVGFVWLGVGLTALGLIHTLTNLKQKPRSLLVLVGVGLLPCFMFALVLTGYANTYIERSLIPALPFVFLLAAVGLRALPGTVRLVTTASTFALASLALLTLYSSFATKFTLYKPHPDWRSAARYLGQQIDAGHAGMPIYTSFPNPRSLSYYDARIQDERNLQIDLSPEEIGCKVSQRLGSWLGHLAIASLKEFTQHNRRLLSDAQLVVRRCQPDPDSLDWPSDRTDNLCFVIRNEWHPNIRVDGSVEELLAHPRTSILHAERFEGVTIYELRILK